MAPAESSSYIYTPGSTQPLNLSRSKIDLFLNCPRCFYLEVRLGLKRPKSFPYTLNNAVDKLLRNEFNHYRALNQMHPLLAEQKIPAKPAPFPDFVPTTGWSAGKISTLHEPTNFLVSGLIDDLWINEQGAHHIVDYKATARAEPVTKLDRDFHKWYKKQVEVYQWILQRNAIKVDPISYFLYATANNDGPNFSNKLQFALHVIPHYGDLSWIEPTLMAIAKLLQAEQIPPFSADCVHCEYGEKLSKISSS